MLGERTRVLHRLFYIQYCANSLTWLRLHVYICIAEYRIGWIFRYTYKYLEHLRNDGRPEIYIYTYIIFVTLLQLTAYCEQSKLSSVFNRLEFCYIIAKFQAIENTRKLALLAISCQLKKCHKNVSLSKDYNYCNHLIY